jgi:hypothetical protein
MEFYSFAVVVTNVLLTGRRRVLEQNDALIGPPRSIAVEAATITS